MCICPSGPPRPMVERQSAAFSASADSPLGWLLHALGMPMWSGGRVDPLLRTWSRVTVRLHVGRRGLSRATAGLLAHKASHLAAELTIR